MGNAFAFVLIIGAALALMLLARFVGRADRRREAEGRGGSSDRRVD